MAKKYDLLVIGGGPGGYTAAGKAGKLGMKVAVVEKEKLGGTCVNRGCIPTKALLYSSQMFSMLQSCDEFGVSTDFISFDYKKMHDYKKRAVQAYRSGIGEMLAQSQVDFIKGTATIRRGKTIEVNGPEGRDYYQADHVVIATGAAAATSGLPGAGLPGVLTSDQLLACEVWNYDRLAIVGGGVIGVEFATIFNALCSQVTMIEKEEHLLGTMDPEVSEALEAELRRKGIQVYCNARVVEIKEGDGPSCMVEKEGQVFALPASRVLLATGRKPYMDGLLGEDANLAVEKGKLKTDANFMTSQKGIYAIGDLVSGIQLAHVAAAQGTYVVERMAGVEHSIRLSVVPNGMYLPLPIVPSCIYTEPEIASVGITEEIAKRHQMKVRCGRYAMVGNGKSIISREENGFIRLIFEQYSNTIVGAQMVCPRATDMIGEMATAIANNLTASQLSLAMRAHPTYSEGIGAAIEDAMRKEV